MATIDRVVLVKLTDEARAAVEPIARRAGEVLSAIPQVREFEIWQGADAKSAGDWDFGLHAQFDDLEAIDTYINDPGHRQFVDQELKQVVLQCHFSRTKMRTILSATIKPPISK